jgi:nicotinate-nucleotide adenylyltransferase
VPRNPFGLFYPPGAHGYASEAQSGPLEGVLSSDQPGSVERLGILGGSFDPPHRGHLHAALAARSAHKLDRVCFVPAARPPHKPGRRLAGGAHRVALLDLLIAGEPELSIDPRELGRDGPSYTIDTLREILAEAPPGSRELFLILGTDNLKGLDSWREIEEILGLAQPIVIYREGDPEGLLQDLEGLSDGALQRLRSGLVRRPPVEASSTDLRIRLGAGEAPGISLPKALGEYIQREGLYCEGS